MAPIRIYALAVAAWVAMIALALEPWAHEGRAGHAGMDMSTGSGGFLASWSMSWGHWTLMVVAMMLPVVAPRVRREASPGVFVLGYTLVWVLAGGALLAALVALDAEPLGAVWLIGTLSAAVVWQFSSPRTRLLRRWSSQVGGLRTGIRSLVICGPLMLSMLASHSLLLMAALTAVMLGERLRAVSPAPEVRPLVA